jgi:hypothetical protein
MSILSIKRDDARLKCRPDDHRLEQGFVVWGEAYREAVALANDVQWKGIASTKRAAAYAGALGVGGTGVVGAVVWAWNWVF